MNLNGKDSLYKQLINVHHGRALEYDMRVCQLLMLLRILFYRVKSNSQRIFVSVLLVMVSGEVLRLFKYHLLLTIKNRFDMSLLAPIVLFTYNRPEHTRLTLEALAKNELASDSDLIIYSDGPKDDAGAGKVQAVRNYLHTVSGFKSITIKEKEKNCGLANSIITGVTEVVNKYGRIIVLEDDMVTSPYFLRYMNDALEIYQNEEKVISIHGYMYPVKVQLRETFFLRGADCWGWATWKRGWELFEADGKKLQAELKSRKLFFAFNMNGSFPFANMLDGQIKGKNDSWAIRWYASAFLKNKLTLYPGRSLLQNTGNDQSGSNRSAKMDTMPAISNGKITVARIPLCVNHKALSAIGDFLRTASPLRFRFINFIRRLWWRWNLYDS